MNCRRTLLSLVLLLTISANAAWAVDGVLNFDANAQSPTYLKAWDLPFPQEVFGVEVYENDATATAQSVALLTANANGDADPSSAVVLSAAGSLQSGWQQYVLANAQSFSGRVWIRVTYASGNADVGSGPAIGYSLVADELTSPQLVSADAGVSFDRLDAHVNLAANLLLDGGSVVLHRRAEGTPTADPLHGRRLAARPNPFNPRTTIEFRLEVPGRATVRVFDLRGRQVAQLLDESVAPGRHSLTWTAEDEAGNALASGVYLIALDAEGTRTVERVALVQ